MQELILLTLLTLVEFPEVFYVSLIDNCESTGDGYGYNSDLAELGNLVTCHFAASQLGQLPPSGLPAV